MMRLRHVMALKLLIQTHQRFFSPPWHLRPCFVHLFVSHDLAEALQASHRPHMTRGTNTETNANRCLPSGQGHR